MTLIIEQQNNPLPKASGVRVVKDKTDFDQERTLPIIPAEAKKFHD